MKFFYIRLLNGDLTISNYWILKDAVSIMTVEINMCKVNDISLENARITELEDDSTFTMHKEYNT